MKGRVTIYLETSEMRILIEAYKLYLKTMDIGVNKTLINLKEKMDGIEEDIKNNRYGWEGNINEKFAEGGHPFIPQI